MFSYPYSHSGNLLSLKSQNPFSITYVAAGASFVTGFLCSPIPIRGAAATLGSTSDQSFTSVQSALPSIGITKHRLRQFEGVQLIREQREKQSQDLAFHTRPFVLCRISPRRPPESQLLYTRRDGRFFLQIMTHPHFGLPFGQDRLIPIGVATLALRQRSRTVRFGTPAEMLDSPKPR